MVAEDDVDMERLQAQIDMSMTFAHNLITSWIKPTHFAPLRSTDVDATQILDDELRRPPRLGVGASIPMAPLLAHEASKLKRRLGRNGAKNEDVVKSQSQDSSKSDDEEHKGRPAKRKTKVDPFAHEGGKKKRKADSEANRYLSVESVSEHSFSLPKGPKKHNSPGKEKQWMGSGDQRSSVTEEQQSATLIPSPPVRLPVQTTSSSTPATLTAPSPLKPSRETYGALIILYLLSTHSPHSSLAVQSPIPGETTPESSRIHTNSMPILDKANLLDIPLLNLDGPPESTDKPGNINYSKRKRRRRKKKARTIARMGDNSH